MRMLEPHEVDGRKSDFGVGDAVRVHMPPHPAWDAVVLNLHWYDTDPDGAEPLYMVGGEYSPGLYNRRWIERR